MSTTRRDVPHRKRLMTKLLVSKLQAELKEQLPVIISEYAPIEMYEPYTRLLRKFRHLHSLTLVVTPRDNDGDDYTIMEMEMSAVPVDTPKAEVYVDQRMSRATLKRLCRVANVQWIIRFPGYQVFFYGLFGDNTWKACGWRGPGPLAKNIQWKHYLVIPFVTPAGSLIVH